MSRINGTIEPLGYDVYISMPAEGVVDVNKIMRNYPTIVDGITIHTNLIVILLKEFDVTLGMDCLSKYHVVVDCQTKEVIMSISGQERIVIVGKRKMVPTCLITVVTVFQLI